MPLPRLSSRPPAPGVGTPPGAFNRQVTFYSPGGRNGDGTQQPPSQAFVCWAVIRALQGEELDKAQQITQRVTHTVTIHYRVEVTESMTIGFWEFGTERIFQIATIENPDEMQSASAELRVMCFEIGQNAGGAL
jgi:SPP1 family predicted phage head-tail adaptor